jgi:hypothetical protein
MVISIDQANPAGTSLTQPRDKLAGASIIGFAIETSADGTTVTRQSHAMVGSKPPPALPQD